MEKKKAKIPKIIQEDPWLAPYEEKINDRLAHFEALKKGLSKHYGSLKKFALGHKYLGLNYDEKKEGWYYREWAPEAYELHVIGDFNDWDRTTHPMKKDEKGVWEIFIDDADFKHESLFKVAVTAANGKIDRIPAYITRVVQNEETNEFAAQVWKPETAFNWAGDNFNPKDIKELVIYESHVGMAQEEARLGTYREFADIIIPRIKKGGYNAIQMMAIQEHPYYGSFGYHVSSFFAPSSRFGTPEDLKYLIKKAHQAGIAVILDIVHSHAVKNILEGLNEFDGTDYQYFHGGGKGNHPDWDSKLFNYGKWEVLQFLLSNIRYWLEEFRFDGFRFDGISSMMYHHHGHISFDHYDKYFDGGVDGDAVAYMQLANTLMYQIKPGAISIAEDVSGMPGLCRPVKDGGLGFTYRLGMGIPDFWTKILKEQRDDDWNMHHMWSVLNNRREKEKTVAYAESHDQGLVGDKTIAFWLMDKEMYTGMMVEDENLVIDRGIALHKMIRLITMASGGEAYLNFMGNEFGHPEWIDFPREGNNWSYHYARRQWSLVDNKDLKYKFLDKFDKDMVKLIQEHKILSRDFSKLLNIDEHNKTLIFKRGKLIFILNFHPTRSIPDYKFFVPDKGEYEVTLNSDDKKYGGHARIKKSVTYKVDKDNTIQMYVTNRTALVLKKKGS
ncbi:MAG: alpha amylase C-terminal domain-containing protein [Flammeovirgaceae bacterium]